jgi:uncharacterized protein (DUF2147 family)
MMRTKSLAALARLTLAGLAALSSLAAASPATSADRSPIGLWQAVNPDTHQPSGWFAITAHDGVYTGTLVKMFLQPGQDPNIVCSACRGDRHGQPWLGLQIVRGMRAEGENSYEGGTILDPRDGNVYDAMMELSPDGQTLTVRGYLGIALLGRNEYWTRLPDSDFHQIDPSIRSKLAADPRPTDRRY